MSTFDELMAVYFALAAYAFIATIYAVWQHTEARAQSSRAEHFEQKCKAHSHQIWKLEKLRSEAARRASSMISQYVEAADAFEASLLKERKAHSITKGLLTKARNRLNPGAVADAKEG